MMSTMNWNNLPNEIKFKIISYMDRDTRISLKLCFWFDRIVMEANPLRILPVCVVEYTGKYYSIALYKDVPCDGEQNWKNNYSTLIKVNTLRQLEMNLRKELSNYDVVGLMQIQPPTAGFGGKSQGPSIEGPLQLSSYNYFLKVKELEVYKAKDSKFLKQFDPIFLQKLRLGKHCNIQVPKIHQELRKLEIIEQ